MKTQMQRETQPASGLALSQDGGKTYMRYQTKRALPRWKRAHELRESGLKFREIAKELNTTIRVAFRCVVNYQEHLLNK